MFVFLMHVKSFLMEILMFVFLMHVKAYLEKVSQKSLHGKTSKENFSRKILIKKLPLKKTSV